MKILLATHALTTLAGTETWIQTMYAELSKGHDVYVRSHCGNSLFPQFKRHHGGITYDLALIQHRDSAEALLPKLKAYKTVFTSHGVIPALEQPIKGMNHYVAVSEEVQRHLQDLGFSSLIIRNPVDVRKFRALRPVNQTLKNILFLTNRISPALDVVAKAAEGFEYWQLGGDVRKTDVVAAINAADLVISLGRGCLEAMACGRNVIVYDRNGCDGYVTPETVVDYRKNNCSGRHGRRQLTPEILRNMFKLYDPDIGQRLRQYVLANNAVSEIADQYLKFDVLARL